MTRKTLLVVLNTIGLATEVMVWCFRGQCTGVGSNGGVGGNGLLMKVYKRNGMVREVLVVLMTMDSY
jgi:hypothetical protein